ncbi:hypothetical protein WJR50_14100 [Catalinimonas sp. 4WD22]|uniref:hypothetical protein n=1 Tax=Catalinimonas locisalis TaxID=3133978 RepID=UPI00310135A7
MKRFFILIVLTIIGFSCEEDLKANRDVAKIKMMKAETQCANPWERVQHENEYKDNIKAYLSSQGLNILQLEVKNELAAEANLCMACTCWSGNNIYINILPAQKDKAEALGFKEVEN